MTVQEFLRAYFSLNAMTNNIFVQRNDGTGRLETAYSSYDGYHEQWMSPEVRNSEIKAWGISVKPNRIWISI